MLWGLSCVDEYVRATVWERHCGKDVVRKTLRKQRCKIDVVERRCEKITSFYWQIFVSKDVLPRLGALHLWCLCLSYITEKYVCPKKHQSRGGGYAIHDCLVIVYILEKYVGPKKLRDSSSVSNLLSELSQAVVGREDENEAGSSHVTLMRSCDKGAKQNEKLEQTGAASKG